MQDVLALVDRARAETVTHNDRLAAKFNLSGQDAPIAGLNMANLHAVVALELLMYYEQIWRTLPISAVPDVARQRQENAERVMTVSKAAFVLALSAFEFSAKQALIARPGKIAPITGRIYLRKIIQESVTAGLIPAGDDHAWEGVIELRNILVHNNGIADATARYNIPTCQQINFVAGVMTSGNLRFFPEILCWSIGAFSRWCDAFLS